AYLETPIHDLADRDLCFQQSSVLHSVRDVLGRDGIPAILATLRKMKPEPEESRATEGGYLMELDDGSVTDLIREELELGLKAKMITSQGGFEMLDLVARWGPERMADQLWALARDSSKKVRDLVVPVLAQIGDEAIRPPAVKMLEESKGALRETAVALLAK